MGRSLTKKRVAPITERRIGAGGSVRPAFASKHTRRIIRSHHTLLKRQAVLRTKLENGSKGVNATADRLEIQKELTAIEAEIYENGGLQKYQIASMTGQNNTRGGDSSKVLVNWLQDIKTTMELSDLSLLEVGCLSVKNACATCGIFTRIERIDLKSQDPQILQQDFMERPLPQDHNQYFDIVSLSLVLNYVPTPQQRGEMLDRTTKFLSSSGLLPALFLVLPAPCILNSRYFSESRLTEIMTSLGYVKRFSKTTSKLIYWLWVLQSPTKQRVSFRKDLLNDGQSRNNFTITLDI